MRDRAGAESSRTGWQAHVVVDVDHFGRGRVAKYYGVANRWPRMAAGDVLRAIERYRGWLEDQGVTTAVHLSSRIERADGRWVVAIEQPYLGPDCDRVFRRWWSIGRVHEMERVVSQLLAVSLKLTDRRVRPSYRVEVKPRDFCLGASGPILVDTCPPVFARYGARARIAARRSNKSCVVNKERREVLDVTGSRLGVVRNLIEHVSAAVPCLGATWATLAAGVVRAQDPACARALEARLSDPETTAKISLLETRHRRTVQS